MNATRREGLLVLSCADSGECDRRLRYESHCCRVQSPNRCEGRRTSFGIAPGERLADMARFEDYADRQGIKILKCFLHVSREEQKKRFIERLDEPEKNWKFSASDVQERGAPTRRCQVRDMRTLGPLMLSRRVSGLTISIFPPRAKC
jgi:polyphosphate kinase 2 PPK2